MPNLFDVIELKKPSTTTSIEKDSKTFLGNFNAAYKLLESIGASTAQSEALKKAQDYLNEVRRKEFNLQLTLPEFSRREVALYLSSRSGEVQVNDNLRNDNLGYLSGLAQSTTGKLRKTADLLGMVIMPYAALDVRSLRNERYRVIDVVNTFTAYAEEAGLSLYAVAPLSLYSVEQHIRSVSADADDVYSATHDSTLSTIGLQLPLFRSMFSAVSSLDKRVTSLEETNSVVKAQITALTNRLTSLEEKVEEARRVAYQAKLEAAAAKEIAIQTEASSVRWTAVDPMVFAVAKGKSISTGDTPAILGPVWGPDFPDILLDVCGLRVVKGQRKKLQDMMGL